MREYAAEVEYVLGKFFELTDGGWSNKRADIEIAHFSDKKQKASEAGKASAQRRSSVRSTSVGKEATSVEEIATDVQPTNNQEPITKEEPSGSLLAAKRRKQLPADFMPSNAGMQFAAERGLNVGEELQKFTDFHTAKGSVMLDWQAAWRTWASNAKTFARGSQVANKQVAIEQRNKTAADEWLAAEGFAA